MHADGAGLFDISAFISEGWRLSKRLARVLLAGIVRRNYGTLWGELPAELGKSGAAI